MDSEPRPDSGGSAFDVARDMERQQRDEQIADDLDQDARVADALAERPDGDRR